MNDTRDNIPFPIVQMTEISKQFPGVLALNNVDFSVHKGEIVGLIGENGAGKSTLMKVLMGIENPDSGEIFLRGEPVKIGSPSEAFRMGIGMVFQEEACLSNLRVYENVFLGREDEYISAGVLNQNQLSEEAGKLLELVGVSVNPNVYLQELSLPKRQMVEVARALVTTRSTKEHAVVILDESTSMLSAQEVEELFATLAPLREWAAFIFISHRLEEIMRYADRIVVMKDGVVVGERSTSSTNISELQELMVGREMSEDYFCVSEQVEPPDEIILEVRNLCLQGVHDVSFNLRSGEILGMAGLIGCGRREVIRSIFGDLPYLSGSITFMNNEISSNSIGEAVKMGIGYIPADRRGEGIIGGLSVMTNLTLATVDRFLMRGLLNVKQERAECIEYIQRLGVRTPSLDTPMENLSGGNQQKVVVGRWLLGESKILLMDQPTRGIDVGAKREVYKMIRELAAGGHSVIIVSDELPELIGLSNRILIFRDGSLTKEIPSEGYSKPTENELIRYM
jgi:ribose transport system ATP-binding protein